MISIFKTFNPVNVLWLALLVIMLRTGFLLERQPTGTGWSAGIFDSFLQSSVQNIFSPFFNLLIAGLMVLGQALLVNYLVNHYNLLGKPTFLPALMYVVLSGLFAPFVFISAPLLCNFLVLWMLFKLFTFYKSPDAKSTAYDLGMIVAIGSMIYLPFVYLVLVIWVGLFLFRPFNWRESAAPVTGFVTVYFFLAVYYYLNNSLSKFTTLWIPLGAKFPLKLNINHYNYLVLIPVLIILLLCLVKLQQNFLKSYVQVRKSFQLLFVLFIIAAAAFYVNTPFNLTHFLLCTIPAAIFSSYYFLYAKSKWFYESLFTLLVLSILYFQFNNF